MTRSKWKCVYLPYSYLRNIKKTKYFHTEMFWSKNFSVHSNFAEKKLAVYNGLKIAYIRLKDFPTLTKLGSFIRTRARYIYKKSRLQKKR